MEGVKNHQPRSIRFFLGGFAMLKERKKSRRTGGEIKAYTKTGYGAYSPANQGSKKKTSENKKKMPS